MIEFITNHPVWTGIILYLIIGILISIMSVSIEGTHLILKEKGLNRVDGESLALYGFVMIFFWPTMLIVQVLDFKDEYKRFKR